MQEVRHAITSKTGLRQVRRDRARRAWRRCRLGTWPTPHVEELQAPEVAQCDASTHVGLTVEDKV
jgi:hypothetical protein